MFQSSHKLKEIDHNGLTITSFLSRIFVTLSLFTESKQFQIYPWLTQNSLHIIHYMHYIKDESDNQYNSIFIFSPPFY